MLSRTRNNISINTANIIYKSFILPVLDYCDIAWNCCGKVNADSLERLQRRAARIIVRTQRSEEALEQLRYEPLESRRERHVLKFVKKCIHGRAPQFFNNYFMFNRDLVPRKTRQSHHLRPPSVKLECSKKSFFTMVVLFLIVICNL